MEAGRIGLVGEVLTIDASSAICDGDKVSRDERVAGLFAAIFRHKLPRTDKAAFKLFRKGWTGVVDDGPRKKKTVHDSTNLDTTGSSQTLDAHQRVK